MRRKMCMILVASCVLAIQSTSISAASNDILVNEGAVVPYMDYIMEASSDIYLNTVTGYATAECSVVGYKDITTKVVVDMKLQQKVSGKWSTIKTYSASENSYYVNMSNECKVSKGYSYRVQTTIKAYSGSSTETKTVTSSEIGY